MSVLIKGMEMPKDCNTCQFHGFGGYKNEWIVCSLTGYSERDISHIRDCPLIEVPSAEVEPIKCEDCKTIIALKAALEPVTRCRDCRFYTEEERWCRRLGLCGAFDPNDYCSHAEEGEEC